MKPLSLTIAAGLLVAAALALGLRRAQLEPGTGQGNEPASRPGKPAKPSPITKNRFAKERDST